MGESSPDFNTFIVRTVDEAAAQGLDIPDTLPVGVLTEASLWNIGRMPEDYDDGTVDFASTVLNIAAEASLEASRKRPPDSLRLGDIDAARDLAQSGLPDEIKLQWLNTLVNVMPVKPSDVSRGVTKLQLAALEVTGS